MTAPTRARLLRGLALLATTSVLAATGIGAAVAAAPAGSPTGNLDKATPVAGGLQVSGWAWDSSTSATVTVRIVAGTTTVSTQAATTRLDVPRYYPAAGTTRGFSTFVALPSGQYTVCATAVNVGAGADTTFRCLAATVTGVAPVGNLDSVTENDQGIRVRGWAADRDAVTKPVTLAVRVDGALVGTTRADQQRLDVPKVYPDLTASSGFLATFPATAGTHEVCVTALDIAGGGDKAFTCRSVSVREHSPQGALASAVEAAPGVLRVTGTAADVDAGTTPVRLTIDGATVITAAATSAPWAFAADLPAAPGVHEVCATALNTGAGTDTDLGCVSGTLIDHDPRGSVAAVTDSPVGGLRVQGVATDVDAPGAASVRVSVDGSIATPVAPAGQAMATQSASEPGSFDLDIPATPGTHRVCVTAVNVGPGTDTDLGCTDVVVIDHSATGQLEKVTGGIATIAVSGWAADRDTTSPLTVSITVDGAPSDVITSAARGDVLAARPDLRAVGGFSASLTATPGSHQVCATVRNVGPGADAALGCTAVTVTAPPPQAPGASTTGVPAGTALTVYSGDLIVTTPGAVISNLDVRGYVRIKAANVTISNTIVRGRPGLTSSTGLVTNLDGYPGLVIQDSELAAAEATPNINGFMGYNATLQRVNIHGVVDSIHITGDNVVIDSSWLHDNLHYDKDPNWNGGPSHDDNIQVQAGSNIVVRNSVLSGSKNAAIMVTQDRGPVAGLVVTGNQLDNGACTVNLAEKSYGPIAATVTNNAFGTGQVYKYCGIKATATTTTVSNVSANTFSDGRTFAVTP